MNSPQNPTYAAAAEKALLKLLLDSGQWMPGQDDDDGDVGVNIAESFSERLDLGPRAGAGLVLEMEDGTTIILHITAHAAQ